MTINSVYSITTAPQKTMFGKRTGGVLARLETPTSVSVIDAGGRTATLAKSALLAQMARAVENQTVRYIFCADNARTVLVVRFSHDSWGYDIIDAERSYPSGCWMPSADLRAAVDAAKSHAEQSYGGVLKAI